MPRVDMYTWQERAGAETMLVRLSVEFAVGNVARMLRMARANGYQED